MVVDNLLHLRRKAQIICNAAQFCTIVSFQFSDGHVDMRAGMLVRDLAGGRAPGFKQERRYGLVITSIQMDVSRSINANE